MSISPHWLIAAGVLCAVGAAPVMLHSARAPEPASATTARHQAVDDTAAVTRYLGAVRGANPLLCEMASRYVDGRGWWSNWGTVSGGALEMDSASGAVLHWSRGEHRNAAVVPALAAALRDGDRCVRRVAGALLARVKHASATSALLAALSDQSEGTRAAAAIGLGIADEERAVQPLIRLLGDASPEVRRSSAWALGAIEHKDAMLPLIELLGRDADARVRQAAAWALGQVSG